MLIVLVAPVVLAALAWFLLRTDHGTAVRAAAENTDRALLLGIPVRRNTTIVWMLAGGLAALAFILKAPFTGFAPGVATTGPARAAARRWPPRWWPAWSRCPSRSAPASASAIIEQVARWNTSGSPSFVDAAVPRRDRRRAPRAAGRPLGGARSRRTSSWSAVGIAPADPGRAPPAARGARPRSAVAWRCSRSLARRRARRRGRPATSCSPASPSCGRWSACRSWSSPAGAATSASASSASSGVGAMVAGNLIADQQPRPHLRAGAGRAPRARSVALVIGLPALRIGSLFLAVTTIAFAVALDSYVLNVNNFPELVPSNVPRPLLFGRYDLEDQYAMYVVCLVVLAAWIVVAARAAQGPHRPHAHGHARQRAGGRRRRRGADAGEAQRLPARRHDRRRGRGAPRAAAAQPQPRAATRSTDSITVFSTAVIGGLELGVGRGRRRAAVPVPRDRAGARRPPPRSSPASGLLFVLYALPGGLGQVLRRAARPPARRRGPPPRHRPRGPVGRRHRWRRCLGAAVDGRAHRRGRGRRPSSRCAARADRRHRGAVVPRRSTSATARSRSSAASTSTWPAARSSRCSAPTAPASPPCSRASAACSSPTAGEVTLEGERHHRPARRRARPPRHGPRARRRQRVPELTVAENLRLAGWMLRHDKARLAAATAEVLELFPALAGPHRPARRRAVRRRAADARPGRRAHHAARGAADRRAVARPRPDGGGRAARRRARGSTSGARPW